MTTHLSKAKALIEASPLKKIWEKIGVKHHRGFCIILSSLHSEKSCGIGEYLDLIPMIDFCKEVGFGVIQLLPINDSGEDSSPYNALSSIALHPIYLSLRSLPYVQESTKLCNEMDKLSAFNTTENVEYLHVLKLKREFLKDYYDLFGEKIINTGEYSCFVQENPWLKKYALYKTLKESASFSTWIHGKKS